MPDTQTAKPTAARAAIDLIEHKVRKTLCDTFSTDRGPIGIQGTIDHADFETLLSFAQIGAGASALVKERDGLLRSLEEARNATFDALHHPLNAELVKERDELKAALESMLRPYENTPATPPYFTPEAAETIKAARLALSKNGSAG